MKLPMTISCRKNGHEGAERWLSLIRSQPIVRYEVDIIFSYFNDVAGECALWGEVLAPARGFFSCCENLNR